MSFFIYFKSISIITNTYVTNPLEFETKLELVVEERRKQPCIIDTHLYTFKQLCHPIV